VLYTARFDGAVVAGGMCGAAPVSLALSLARRGTNDRVGGSLAAYCGKSTFIGKPIRILRIEGSLPKQP
jgi:hypothetical protein